MARSKRTADVVSLLNAIPLFSALSKRELQAIASEVKEVDFPAGHEICREGDTGIGLHIVVEGETKVQVGGRTRRRLGAGAFFGEIALLDGGPRTATVIADTPVKTLVIPAWGFRSTLKAHPTLAIKLLEEVCRRIRAADASMHH